MKRPLVSIITVNFNQWGATASFLDYCGVLSYPNVEIILVDNASKDNRCKHIQVSYPGVNVIRSEKNLGFAGGNNLAIPQAAGEFLLFLNNDTRPEPDLIERLLEGFESEEKPGVVCPKIQFVDPPDVIQFAGYTKINPFTGRNKAIGKGELDTGQYQESKLTPYAHGAAMMVKREVIEKVGPMPEDFFLYYEELDWSVKIRKAGYTILFYPQALVFHLASLSVGKDSLLKAYYYHRNRILFMRRNVNIFPFILFCLFILFASTPKVIGIYLIQGKWKHILAYCKALGWHLGINRSTPRELSHSIHLKKSSQD